MATKNYTLSLNPIWSIKSPMVRHYRTEIHQALITDHGYPIHEKYHLKGFEKHKYCQNKLKHFGPTNQKWTSIF